MLNVFMDKVLSTTMSMGILAAAFILLYFAYRSKSDGKALVKTAIEKRNLFIEIILLFMGLIEGVNAASYAVKEGRDFGASIAMHVLGGIISGVFAFGIYKQVTDVALALRDSKHPVIIGKEILDVVITIGLAILFPIVNSYFVAIVTNAHQDFWNTLFLDWGRIKHGSVFYSTILGEAHIVACLSLSLNSFDTSVFETTADDGGVIVPLTQASDSTDDDAEAETTTDDEEDTSTDAPNQDIIPYSRIPDRTNILNYIKTHLSHRVDIDRIKHKMMIDDLFLDKVAVAVEDCLKVCDKWDAEKAILQAAKVEVEKKKKMLSRARQSYNFDENSRVSRGLNSEIEHLEGQIVITAQLAEDAELVYNNHLNKLGDLLDIL